ncbi:MAG: hypothetical protein J6X30_05165 [Clostridia bacterium]|nr:hypothetical protein [Clostridia bacterium]
MNDTFYAAVFFFCFAGAILLYAGLLALTKDIKLLPYRIRRTMNRTDKAYMLFLARVVACIAVLPFAFGLILLFAAL